MTRSEIRRELEEGTEAASKRAKVPPLGPAELDHLLDLYASPSRFTGVAVGDEVVLTYDGSGSKTVATRMQDLQIYEQMFGADTVELGTADYSFKAVKPILGYEAQTMRDAQLGLTVPLNYGAMPNLGLYSKPDGPAPNWSELRRRGRDPQRPVADRPRRARPEERRHTRAGARLVLQLRRGLHGQRPADR
jgi:dimethylamine--corrinoid protein Co-methyltransferase